MIDWTSNHNNFTCTGILAIDTLSKKTESKRYVLIQGRDCFVVDLFTSKIVFDFEGTLEITKSDV